MNKTHQAFSLLELMAVVAIIAILAAGGIPSYQHYIKKSRFNELVTAAMPFKAGVELCYQTQGELNNCDSGKQHVPPAISTGSLAGMVDSVQVTNGRITVTPKKQNGINKQDTFVLIPTIKSHHLQWARSGGAVDAGLVSGS